MSSSNLMKDSSPKCFVIQPFDGQSFDQRYAETCEPAIKKAGYTPYRVDQDPGAQNLIEHIEGGIRAAAVCLADITKDNPNVWYELGYAMAVGTPVCMICSEERGRFPFDIQHLRVIRYKTQSKGDFERLESRIVECLTEIGKQPKALPISVGPDSTQASQHLRETELAVLTAMLELDDGAGGSVTASALRQKVRDAGHTPTVFALGTKRLTSSGFLKLIQLDEIDGPQTLFHLSAKGWAWAIENEDRFPLQAPPERWESPF